MWSQISAVQDVKIEAGDRKRILQLICHYVDRLIKRNGNGKRWDKNCDEYLGDAGIAVMFLKIHQDCPELRAKYPCLDLARNYVECVKRQPIRELLEPEDKLCDLLMG